MGDVELRERAVEFFRANRKKIIRRWELSTMSLESGRETVVAVRNSVPRMIDEIEAALHPSGRAEGAALSTGFDLREVVGELTVIRRVLSGMLAKEGEPGWAPLVEEAVDAVVLRAIDHADTRRRSTAAALDEILAAAFGSLGLHDLLARLVEVPRGAASGAEAVAIFLLEKDALRLRAMSGLGDAATAGIALPVGEGFAGTVAAGGKALELRDPGAHPMLKSDPIRAAGLRCVYGVPLMNGDAVLGVAIMGSREVAEFSEGDRRLFRTFAARAATAILHHQLRTALDEKRDDLVNAIAHDLKTPMQALGGFAELMRERRERAGDVEEVEWLRKMGGHVDRMNRLLSDLLDVRLLATGRLTVSPAKMAYLPLLEDIAHQWTVSSPDRTWTTDLAPSLEVVGDRYRIAQVLNNLFSNAVKYSPAGSAIEVRARRDGPRVVTSVTDHGVGLPKEQWSRIFRRYERAAGAGQHAQGYGIGLYISAELVRAQKGELWLESEPGRGSTFSFSLPAAG